MANGVLTVFRWIGYAEGSSFLVLLGIAMPIKYLAHVPEVVLVVGWAHGVLWVLYLAAALQAWIVCQWPFKVLFYAGVASVLPFGPFVLDRWLRRWAMQRDRKLLSNNALPERAPGMDDPRQRQ